jgi:predicted Zn-dependent protease
VYVFHGFAPASSFTQAEPTLVRVADGFGVLTDPEALGIQPVRIHVITAERSATFRELAAPYSIPEIAHLDLEALGLLNGVAPGDVVARGTLLKMLRQD